MKKLLLLNMLTLLGLGINQVKDVEKVVESKETIIEKAPEFMHKNFNPMKRALTPKGAVKGSKLNLMNLAENSGDFLYTDFLMRQNAAYTMALAVDKGLALQTINFEVVGHAIVEGVLAEEEVNVPFECEPDRVDIQTEIGSQTSGGTYVGTECEWLYFNFGFDDVNIDVKFYSIEFTSPTLDNIQALMVYEGIEPMQDSFYSDYESVTGPVISGSSGTYYANVDNPVTVEYLQSFLIAIDETDGDITDRIIISKDTYTGNGSKVGEYEVVFSVSDTAGNTSTFTLNVYVQDKTAPVIEGQTSFTYSYAEPVTIEEIKAQFTITDNVDKDLELAVESDTYTENAHLPGDYRIVLSATDKSNNKTTKVVDIHVIDDVAPVINGADRIEKSLSSVLSVDDLIEWGNIHYSAEDAIDGGLQLQIESDNYTGNGKKVGTYQVVISATDNSGNKATKTITIVVFDDVKPIWYIKGENQIIINVDQTLKLNEDDIKRVLRRECYYNLDDITLFAMEDVDGYFAEENPKVGNYDLRYNIKSQTGKEENVVVTLAVKEVQGQQETPKKDDVKNWFEKNFDFKTQAPGAVAVEVIGVGLIALIIFLIWKKHND